MIITPEQLRPALNTWVRGQERTVEAMRRALAVVYRDHPGGRSLEEICLSLLFAVAHRHQTSVDGALHRLDDAMVRLLEDVQALRGTAESRPAALRAEDLKAVTTALEEMVKFEDRVRFMLDHEATELGEGLRATLDAATPPAPSRAARVVPGLLESRRRGAGILADGEQVLAAYATGVSLERRPVPVRAHQLLDQEMAQLRRAMAAYRRVTSENPHTVLAAVERLRTAVAHASETLRASGGESRFSVRVSGAHVPTRPNPAAGRGTVDARTLAVGRALTERAWLAEATPGRLFQAMTVDRPVVQATGRVGEPLARSLAGVGLERYVPGADQIRGWRTSPPWLASRLATLLTSGGHPWERAHLIGPGFGAELLLGIMLAPRGVNQVAQNRGIEQFLRYAAQTVGQDVHVTAEVHGRRLAVPLVDGAFDHVDVMESVHYQVPVPGGQPLTYDVHVQPNGSWRVTHNLPEGAITIPLRGRE